MEGGNLSYRVDETVGTSDANQEGWSLGGTLGINADLVSASSTFTYSVSETRTKSYSKSRSTTYSKNIPENSYGRVDEYFNGGIYAGIMLLATQALRSEKAPFTGNEAYAFMGSPTDLVGPRDQLPTKYKYIAFPMIANVLSDDSASSSTAVTRIWKPGTKAPKP